MACVMFVAFPEIHRTHSLLCLHIPPTLHNGHLPLTPPLVADAVPDQRADGLAYRISDIGSERLSQRLLPADNGANTLYSARSRRDKVRGLDRPHRRSEDVRLRTWVRQHDLGPARHERGRAPGLDRTHRCSEDGRRGIGLRFGELGLVSSKMVGLVGPRLLLVVSCDRLTCSRNDSSAG